MEFHSKLHNICFWLWIECTVTSSPLFALKICFFHVLEEIETLPLSSGQYDKVEGIIFFNICFWNTVKDYFHSVLDLGSVGLDISIETSLTFKSNLFNLPLIIKI